MNDRIREFIESASRTLSELLLAEEPVLDGSVGVDERARELLQEVGRLATERCFNDLGWLHAEALKSDGYKVVRAPRVKFQVAFGDVYVRSPYLQKPGVKRGARPLLEQHGVRGGRCSALVLRWIADFGLERPFEKASKAMAEHHGLDVGATTVRLRTLASAERMMEWQEQRLRDAPGAEAESQKPLIFIELDGCHLPVVRWMSAGQLNRTDHPPDKLLPECAWTEARTGTARVAGEVTPLFICRRDEYDELTLRLEGLVNQLGGGLDTQIVAIGDGAVGLKEALQRRFPNLLYILDRGHLKSHLYAVADALEVEDRTGWVKAVTAVLAAGGEELILDGLKGPAGEEAARNAGTESTNIVQNFREHLMRFKDSVAYDVYEANDWPIGSGEVESAHRYISQDRMKKAGAWWLREHLNPMLAARAVRANDRWDEYWRSAA